MSKRGGLTVGLVACAAILGSREAGADNVPQPLPLLESWTDTSRLSKNNDWSSVPGIIGRRGNGLVAANDVDPQMILADGTSTTEDVRVNRGLPTNASFGGLLEIDDDVDDPLVALQPSPAADAPHLVLLVDTTGVSYVHVAYELHDVEATSDDAAAAVALQYRVGATGAFTNVSAAFVADATDAAPGTDADDVAGPVTQVAALLPADAGNRPRVEIRILVARHASDEEWVGIDDIAITASAGPAAVGWLAPDALVAGAATTIDVEVTPGVAPPSTGLAVRCDLSSLGGSAGWPLTAVPVPSSDVARFTGALTLPVGTPAGDCALTCTARDDQGRTSVVVLELAVLSVCGDGRVELDEACDDGDDEVGDGCAACELEPGWACAGSPSSCGDVDECAVGTDDCAADAACTNQVGGFSCACPAGHAGDGHVGDGATGCVDVDECAGGNECVELAACVNRPGGYACVCPPGYQGDGRDDGDRCGEIDECATGEAGCAAHATCTNLPGSFACTCVEGFAGDGQVCASICGDGQRLGEEQCDDGGADGGDGCDEVCQIEGGYRCAGEPSACTADADLDGVADELDNCPTQANHSQSDRDGDGVGDGCDAEGPGGRAGAGCATSDGGAGVVTALALLGLLAIRRRCRGTTAPASPPS